MDANLELDCVATQQDTGTIYGIATARGEDNNGIFDTHVVLIKSNSSPTDLTSLKWSIVSTTPGLDLSYVYPTFTTVDCAVSSKGEFIALFPNFELPTTKTPTIPMGVRYDPVSNRLSGIRGSPIYGFLQSRTYTARRQFTPGPNQLYINLNEEDTIGSFPFTSAVTASPTSTSSFSEHARFHTGMFFSGVRGNLTTFVAAMGYFNGTSIYTIERDAYGSWTQNPVHEITGANVEGNFEVHPNMITAGGRLPGQEPFAVAVTTKGLYELQLFGPSAGNLTGPIIVTIPSSSLYSSRPPRATPKYSVKLTGAEKFGVAMGVLVAVFVVSLFVRRWKMKEYQRKKDMEKAATMEGNGGGEVYMMGIIPETQTAPEAAIYVDTSGNGQRGSSPSAFAAPPAAGSPQPSTAYTYQDEIQGLELTSHPRPNVTTSVGDTML